MNLEGLLRDEQDPEPDLLEVLIRGSGSVQNFTDPEHCWNSRSATKFNDHSLKGAEKVKFIIFNYTVPLFCESGTFFKFTDPEPV